MRVSKLAGWQAHIIDKYGELEIEIGHITLGKQRGLGVRVCGVGKRAACTAKRAKGATGGRNENMKPYRVRPQDVTGAQLGGTVGSRLLCAVQQHNSNWYASELHARAACPPPDGVPLSLAGLGRPFTHLKHSVEPGNLEKEPSGLQVGATEERADVHGDKAG